MQLMSLPKKILQCGQLQLDLSQPQIMGILNVTPDSFSDGGLYYSQDQAVAHARQMIKDGATIIDIGGESTRPNATTVSVDDELKRVIPVVEKLAQEQVVISIDTSQPEVIRAAVAAGAHLWNDVRALTRPNALETAAKLDVPVILMHIRGEPSTMNQLAKYEHVTFEVMQELQQRIDQALQAGVRAENIILDPGFGFAKNTAQNLKLLQEFWQLHALGYPILSALSRKRFIGAVLEQPEAGERMIGSVAAHLISIQQGACMVRVHDVKATAQAIKIWQAMQHAE
ncbi:dihydropteroate synthase [Acinetobacter qingfengensis]|uniref:Dihydropteroate synthase n=1 Tax=Acinetobacter qingfengensis TaxID=1262585 RepID=A0A1E7RDW5_9GAMM|nr:dihydropteroate synthase [Acinetobacter qingfengensis]KAA8735286.1 dihydropteroate synthase [Acinetobacter qingfengensis]OEY97452.1 dihydropteroate synthase [Acinetobacter qingfengensis]